jgi:hypothetical protein
VERRGGKKRGNITAEDETARQREAVILAPDVSPEDKARAVFDAAGAVLMQAEEARERENIQAVNTAITEIANGAEEAAAKGIRPDLTRYGGNGDVTFIWGG